MAQVNLPDNSHASKEAALEQYKNAGKTKMKGSVVTKKKGLGSRLLSNIINEDAGSIKDYIVDELLGPIVKTAILSAITGCANRYFGNGGSSATVRGSGNARYVDYSTKSSRPDPIVSHRRSRYDVKNIIFSDKEDADRAKKNLCALIESEYRQASIGDLYDYLGEETESTDFNYGWNTTKGIFVSYYNGGYKLNLPNPIPLR